VEGRRRFSVDASLVPPAELDYGTAVDWVTKTGPEFAHYCRELGGLRPDGSILDVGCGFGPLAAALTEYLTPAARFEGFDIVPAGVEWAQSRITARYPNFRFTWLDVYNDGYHPEGKLDPRSVEFPYRDAAFDLVHLRSVFTHMLPEEVDHYLGEIRRVMRPDGRCLISYFLINNESLELMENGQSSKYFLYDHGVYRCNRPEHRRKKQGYSIAYEEGFIRSLYRKRGLRLIGPVHYGAWCGRGDPVDGQDILVAGKGGQGDD
jgi:SAM-dependent methyltransferase